MQLCNLRDLLQLGLCNGSLGSLRGRAKISRRRRRPLNYEDCGATLARGHGRRFAKGSRV
jgi:hypothetical protein